LGDQELSWQEIQALVRKGVVKSIFEFKEQIKAVVSAPQRLPQRVKEAFADL
jgi:hypothetical protein